MNALINRHVLILGASGTGKSAIELVELVHSLDRGDAAQKSGATTEYDESDKQDIEHSRNVVE